jgi:hypothetical protein
MSSNKFEIGDQVIATPKAEDDWHEFQGHVKGFRDNGNLITVEDQEGDCFDCEIDQLKFLEEDDDNSQLPDSVEVMNEFKELPAYREFVRERNEGSLTFGDR